METSPTKTTASVVKTSRTRAAWSMGKVATTATARRCSHATYTRQPATRTARNADASFRLMWASHPLQRTRSPDERASDLAEAVATRPSVVTPERKARNIRSKKEHSSEERPEEVRKK